MEANINNTSASDIIHRVPIKIRYKAKGVIRTKNLNARNDSNLEKTFDTFWKKRNLIDEKSEQDKREFYLFRDGKKIKLDKYKRISELSLKESDLIEVAYKNQSEIKEKSKHNRDSDESSGGYQSKCKKKTLIRIGIIAAIVILALIIFLLCYYLFIMKKDKDNNVTKTNNNEGNQDSTKEDPKLYSKEPLVANKLFYDQTNTLFLYKSEKNISLEIGLRPETEKVKDESDYTKIKQDMDFCFIVEKRHQEIDQEKKILYPKEKSYLITIRDIYKLTKMLTIDLIWLY